MNNVYFIEFKTKYANLIDLLVNQERYYIVVIYEEYSQTKERKFEKIE